MQNTITLTELIINNLEVNSISFTVAWNFHWEQEQTINGGDAYRVVDYLDLLDWEHYYGDDLNDEDVIDWFEFNKDKIQLELLEL